MQNSLLLVMNGGVQSELAATFGVELARRWKARLRGITLIDTRRLGTVSTTSDAAIHTSGEFQNLRRIEQQQGSIRAQLTQSCLTAGIDFDLRILRGDPFRILPMETRFHDLVLATLPTLSSALAETSEPSFSAQEWIQLIGQGVRPLLILRSDLNKVRRVLLVHNGSSQSANTIRTFLSQDLLPKAELRLLAIGQTESESRAYLQEMHDYCRRICPDLEFGMLCGSWKRVLAPYVEKWETDLVVTGCPSSNFAISAFSKHPFRILLENTNAALYLHG